MRAPNIVTTRWQRSKRKNSKADRQATSQELGKERLKRDLARDETKAQPKAQSKGQPASAPHVYYPVVVTTKEELEAAAKNKEPRILVLGDLASKLELSFQGLRKLSSSSLNTLALVLSGAALFAPFTGGVSLGAAGTVMGTVGAALTATAIAAISAIGLALVIAVFKGYDEVKLSGGGIELVLRSGKEQDPEKDAASKTKERKS